MPIRDISEPYGANRYGSEILKNRNDLVTISCLPMADYCLFVERSKKKKVSQILDLKDFDSFLSSIDLFESGR